MRRPTLRAVKHEFDWEDGSKPDKLRMPHTRLGWDTFCTVYEQLDRERARELMVPLARPPTRGRGGPPRRG
jgi:hypothetical protein